MRPGRPPNPVEREQQRALTLTSSALEAARRLGLSPADTAAVLGVQQGTLQGMKKGERVVDGTTGEAEAADALVKVLSLLKALLGDDESKWRAWLRRPFPQLNGRPLDVMTTRHGIVKVATALARVDAL